MVNSWYLITRDVLARFWQGFLNFIPRLIGSTIVFIIGWFVSVWIGRLTAEILKRLMFDKIFESKGWKDALAKADIDISPSEFIGAIVKWVLIIVSLLAAVDILGWYQFSIVLGRIVAYLPNVIAAALIFVVTVILADIIAKLVKAGVKGMNINYARLTGEAAKWIIWIFGIFAILVQLGIASNLLLILFRGLVYFFVIAGGLAFGLGGKDAAARFLEDLRNRMNKSR